MIKVEKVEFFDNNLWEGVKKADESVTFSGRKPHSLGDFFVCLKEAPKQTLCSLIS